MKYLEHREMAEGTIDPATPMLFCRVAWMDRYAGLATGDTMTGGGSYVQQHQFGHEMMNFSPHHDFVYGYVQPPTTDKSWAKGRINLARLGASHRGVTIARTASQ